VTVTDPMTAEDLKALKPEKREFNKQVQIYLICS